MLNGASALIEFIKLVSEDERGFGRYAALLSHGRHFPVRKPSPSWLRRGPMKQCFTNARSYARVRQDVWYVEGYAFDIEIAIPHEHAWLVDTEGYAIDPTWDDMDNNAYFGIPFKTTFVEDNAQLAEGGGFLHPPLMRRRWGTPELFASNVETGLPDI